MKEPRETLKFGLDERLRMGSHRARITSDAGLRPVRELGGALGLMKMAPTYLQDTRGGRNVHVEGAIAGSRSGD